MIRTMLFRPAYISALPLAVSTLGCGPSSATTPDLIEPQSIGSAFGSESCSAFRSPTEPDLMGWDSGARANLKSMREQGVVAVRYKAEGCNVELEVLNCTGEGSYEFSAYPSSDTKVSKSTRDLYADLPIGAARLGSKVGGGRALRTDYMMTGVYRLSSYEVYSADKLKGAGCKQATHVVAKMYVGGFGMSSGTTESVAAGAGAFSAQVVASQDRLSERIAIEGNPRACEKAQQDGKDDPLCSVPLRIGLIPLAPRHIDAPASLLDEAAERADTTARGNNAVTPAPREQRPSSGGRAIFCTVQGTDDPYDKYSNCFGGRELCELGRARLEATYGKSYSPCTLLEVAHCYQYSWEWSCRRKRDSCLEERARVRSNGDEAKGGHDCVETTAWPGLCPSRQCK